ncbi:STAS domain-containing protein [Jatrophihabitans endophyticus]|uniref:STAS domain-containing protein n=1 Tax=Jatrophihabitans endophyticus TaxID=1206085 RepID=UPI001A03152D|nr:STAS domain-containing protein [Jatrophihabitans endophyticus]MBE7188559.1 STAS domain-containing protein [Jatrophihabitans endophyticus]
MDLRVRTERPADGEVVLHVTGSIDIESRHELLHAASESFTDDIAAWVVDLSQVTFMDSTGIAALVLVSNDAEDNESRFVVRNPSPTVQRILEVTGLLERWPDD